MLPLKNNCPYCGRFLSSQTHHNKKEHIKACQKKNSLIQTNSLKDYFKSPGTLLKQR
jgi:Ca2+-binding EF-hand superfamily protein